MCHVRVSCGGVVCGCRVRVSGWGCRVQVSCACGWRVGVSCACVGVVCGCRVCGCRVRVYRWGVSCACMRVGCRVCEWGGGKEGERWEKEQGREFPKQKILRLIKRHKNYIASTFIFFIAAVMSVSMAANCLLSTFLSVFKPETTETKIRRSI